MQSWLDVQKTRAPADIPRHRGGRRSYKLQVITLGKWMTVKWPDGTGMPVPEMKVRALLVDTRLKELTTALPQEITGRLFVVRRAFRVNDSLPAESALRWEWQRGGWLLVDRGSRPISQLNQPEIESFYSAANWYRRGGLC